MCTENNKTILPHRGKVLVSTLNNPPRPPIPYPPIFLQEAGLHHTLFCRGVDKYYFAFFYLSNEPYVRDGFGVFFFREENQIARFQFVFLNFFALKGLSICRALKGNVDCLECLNGQPRAINSRTGVAAPFVWDSGISSCRLDKRGDGVFRF